MKMLKPSKLLLFSLMTAVITGLAGFDGVSAASRQSAYTVRDMMARRGRPPKSVTKPAKRTTPKVIRKSAAEGSYTNANVGISNAAGFEQTVMLNKDGSLFPGGPCVDCQTGPIDKDGSLFPGGSCINCQTGPLIDTGPCIDCQTGPLIDTGPCINCEKPKPLIANYAIPYTPYIYQSVERNCCAMAPLYLEHVDFNLDNVPNNGPEKLGNYRFRIFGCRRYDKEAILNRGRIMEKDMNFSQIFGEVTGDCYNLVKMPDDLCLQTTPSPLPEYILTAEITNFFMNVCDGYDWQDVQKQNSRTGSAEMTVTWRLTNLTKTKVLWEGQTTGYSDLDNGATNGEIKLVEDAFADAASNLSTMPGFEDQLMIRLTPEELTEQRNALIDEEIALNPAKCRFEEELTQVKNCEISRPESDINQCPAYIEQKSGVVSDYEVFDNVVVENSGVVSDGDCAKVDDTWVDMQQNTTSFDSLCIVDRPPYETLSPENLYKVRASVVEINGNADKKGAGLIISESFVLTSADLVDKTNNHYQIKTINGKELTGHAVRVNPVKNIALIMLDTPTEYTPLSLNLDLPKVNQSGFMVLGMLDVSDFNDGENYIDNSGKVAGYRYSEDKGSEIMMNTFVQNVTIGGVLIDANGTINGVAHSGKKTDSGMDLFLPTETALRSVGLSICEKLYAKPSPWQQTVYKPVTEKIMAPAPKAPEAMKEKDRK